MELDMELVLRCPDEAGQLRSPLELVHPAIVLSPVIETDLRRVPNRLVSLIKCNPLRLRLRALGWQSIGLLWSLRDIDVAIVDQGTQRLPRRNRRGTQVMLVLALHSGPVQRDLGSVV